MFIIARYSKVRHSSISGAIEYQFGHLANSTEIGHLKETPGYLAPDGGITPFLQHPDLWREVGWDPESQPFSPQLAQALLHGTDLGGRRLTTPRPGGKGYQDARELLITVPTEVSHYLATQDPMISVSIMRDLFDEAVRQIEALCVRRRVGGGEYKWEGARSLSLGYLHAESRAGEPELHLHIWSFAPAMTQRGEWRTRDNRAHLEALQGFGFYPDFINRQCGRAHLTQVVVEACQRHRINVVINREFAGAEARVPHGASVSGPGRAPIPAGSIRTTRQPIVLAEQALVTSLGARPFTPRESQIISAFQGSKPEATPVHHHRQYFLWKLSHHGFLDQDGRIAIGRELRHAWAGVELGMAIAEAHLEAASVLSLAYADALGIVRRDRRSICDHIGQPFRASRADAITEWKEQIIGAMRWAMFEAGIDLGNRSGPTPTRPSQFLLSVLSNAGWIRRRSHANRPQTFEVTKYGLAEFERAYSSSLSPDSNCNESLGAMFCMGSSHQISQGSLPTITQTPGIDWGRTAIQAYDLRAPRPRLGNESKSSEVPYRDRRVRLSIPGRAWMESTSSPRELHDERSWGSTPDPLSDRPHPSVLGVLPDGHPIGSLSTGGRQQLSANPWAHSYASGIPLYGDGYNPDGDVAFAADAPRSEGPSLQPRINRPGERGLHEHHSGLGCRIHLGAHSALRATSIDGISDEESILRGPALMRPLRVDRRIQKSVMADYRTLLHSMGAFEDPNRSTNLPVPRPDISKPTISSPAPPSIRIR